MSDVEIDIELSGIPATDRARGEYLSEELQNLGFGVGNSKRGDIDVRIVLSRQFDIRRGEEHGVNVFDVSDAIFTPPRDRSVLMRIYQKMVVNRRSGRLMSLYDAVVVACRAQQLIMQKYNPNVYVIPDSSYYHNCYDPAKKPDVSDKVVFVWDGQGHNFQYLEDIITCNVDFFRRDDVLLKVVTDRNDRLHNINIENRLKNYQINVEFIEWKADSFMHEVNTAHVGLAPVDIKCPHAMAKPDNKMINYQGLGLTVIASSSMAYKDYSHASGGEVIICETKSDWRQALEYWFEKRRKIIPLGLHGRRYVLDNYTPVVLAKKWEQVILDLIG